MDETTKDDGGIAGPACSAPVLAIFGAGFHPIGQNGLRSPASKLKEDLCFNSMVVVSSASTTLLQVVRQETTEKMTALVEKIASQGGATRQQLREAATKPKPGRPKHYVFAYRPPTKAFNLKLSFAKSRASKDDVIEALEAIIRDLRKK